MWVSSCRAKRCFVAHAAAGELARARQLPAAQQDAGWVVTSCGLTAAPQAQDEAIELTGGPAGGGSAERGLGEMAAHCAVAAVTLGERGCLVQARGGVPFAEPAASGVRVVDSTGKCPRQSFAGKSFCALHSMQCHAVHPHSQAQFM